MNISFRVVSLSLMLGLLAVPAFAQPFLASTGASQRSSAEPPKARSVAGNKIQTAADEDAQEAPEAAAEDENVVQTVRITTSASRNTLVCRNERPVGSHIPKQVCRSHQQMAEDRQDGKRRVRDSRLDYAQSRSRTYDSLNGK